MQYLSEHRRAEVPIAIAGPIALIVAYSGGGAGGY
jgi:hypothetical protein